MPTPHVPPDSTVDARLAALPKAELHLHMEGSIEPATVVALARRCGESVNEATVAERYAPGDFATFIEAYKWVTSYLRAPEDYALVARRMCERLVAQNVIYAEVTLSVGVMLLRGQDVAANFRAICEAAAPFAELDLRLQWIFDCVRQFGAAAAYEVARRAVELRSEGVVAYGMGGDELAVPTGEFRSVYDYVASNGLRRLVHAGEIGGSDSIRGAIELLGAERIGHGIAAARDPELISLLIERKIPLEICPTSNIRTGALARQLGVPHASLPDHPLPALLRAGVPINISTDDPAMFQTSLHHEYLALAGMGLSDEEILRLAEAAFHHSFLAPSERAAFLGCLRSRASALGLI